MCAWRHNEFVEAHFVSDTMSVWTHSVCLGAQSVSGDTMCVWRNNVCLEMDGVSGSTLEMQCDSEDPMCVWSHNL